jgi:hypothetical protein
MDKCRLLSKNNYDRNSQISCGNRCFQIHFRGIETAINHSKKGQMKIKILSITLIIVIATGLSYRGFGQKLRLNAYGNYVFDDKVESSYSNTDYFNGTIQGGFMWGVGLEYRLHELYGLELLYLRQDTKAPVNYYSLGAKHADFDIGVNYIMAAGARSFSANEKVEGYGGLMLGAAIIDAKNTENNNSNSATKFAWGIRLGVNIWASESVGIKLQTQLLSAVQAAGGTLYFGTGGGGAGVSGYSSMLQFTLGGGLTFRFGH